MIRINLLGQESARDNTGVLQIAAFAVSLVLLIGVFFLLNGSLVDENNLLTQEKESLELKLEGVKKRTKEVRDLEKKRTRLKEKLVVIARLKKSKTG
ncbi:MAG: DUF5320 domain-containing protein, partial [Bdellovibrionales bacterium]|nr:DUF5320 domain-containing protein [Bdellovibrionales bacterium]